MGILTPGQKALSSALEIGGLGTKSAITQLFNSLGDRSSMWRKEVVGSNAKYFKKQTDVLVSDATYWNVSSMKNVLKTIYTKPRALLELPLRYSYAALQSLGMSAIKMPWQSLKTSTEMVYDVGKTGVGISGAVVGGILAGIGEGVNSVGKGVTKLISGAKTESVVGSDKKS